MKALSKPFITWFLSLFNLGIYSVSDDIDSFIVRLKSKGLNDHANTIQTLSDTIEYQQSIIIVLDGIKCIFMVISLVLLILANQNQIQSLFASLKAYSKRTSKALKRKVLKSCFFIQTKFQKLYLFFKNLLKFKR